MDYVDELNPYDLMDAEAARLDAFYALRDEEDWARPTACEGWDVHDLLAHLAGSEEYNHACLDDTVGETFASYAQRGVTDVHSFNAIGVADRRDRSHTDVLQEWRDTNARTRHDLRARDGQDIPTMVGPYPARLQAFHLAAELATHADDTGVPEQPAEATDREAWRAKVAAFMLHEARPDQPLRHDDHGWHVDVDGHDITLDDRSFAAVVNGRGDSVEADAPLRAALDLMA